MAIKGLDSRVKNAKFYNGSLEIFEMDWKMYMVVTGPFSKIIDSSNIRLYNKRVFRFIRK